MVSAWTKITYTIYDGIFLDFTSLFLSAIAAAIPSKNASYNNLRFLNSRSLYSSRHEGFKKNENFVEVKYPKLWDSPQKNS
jgi:hypothetical protein